MPVGLVKLRRQKLRSLSSSNTKAKPERREVRSSRRKRFDLDHLVRMVAAMLVREDVPADESRIANKGLRLSYFGRLLIIGLVKTGVRDVCRSCLFERNFFTHAMMYSQ